MSDLTGTIIQDRYTFDLCLGEGTFAKVYRVHDQRRNVELAAKVLRTDIVDGQNVLDRFRRESDVLESLQHPNIVRFYDFIETDDVAFILMEYISGETLQASLYNIGRPLSVLESFTFLKPMAAALHFAHGEGIVHRDLKPANILIHKNGNLFVSDFGIAHVLDDITLAGEGKGAIGTPLYMAPEQILNTGVSIATDVYALGVLLYQMLTGTVPFSGAHPTSIGGSRSERIAYEHLRVKAQPLRSVVADISLAVDEVVLQCLSKEPMERPSGVREVYDALAEAIGAAPSELTPLPQNPVTDVMPISLPEVSQFVKFSKNEDGSDEITLETSRQNRVVVAEEEETAENVYPIQVLEGKERPTIENHRPPVVSQQLPPDQVSIQKPTPPGIVIPTQMRPVTEVQRTRSAISPTMIVSVGILLVILSCGALAAYMAGIFDETDSTSQQPTRSVSIPTITPEDSRLTQSTPEGITTTVIAPNVLSDPTEVSGNTDNDATSNTTSGLIAYASHRYGSLDIFLTDPAATEIRLQLTTDETLNETGPAWSPNGTQIAYYAYQDDHSDIFVMDANGENVRNLTNSADEDDRYVTWSPDGTRLAFHSNRRDPNNRDRDYEIFIFDLRSNEILQVTDNDVYDLGPDWSPDGTQLAFHSLDIETGQYRVTVINLTTSEQRYITPPSIEARFPTWSPDGTQLAFHVEEDNNYSQIYVADVAGENFRPLLQVAVNDLFPDWSPDGLQIVFHRRTTEGFYGLYRYNFLTGEVSAIGDQLGDFFPDWIIAT